MSAKKQIKALTFDERVNLINCHLNDQTKTQKELSIIYKISQSQVQRILANKENILEDYQNGTRTGTSKRNGMYSTFYKLNIIYFIMLNEIITLSLKIQNVFFQWHPVMMNWTE